MSTETDRKRFHLEKIIESISQDSPLVNTTLFNSTLVSTNEPYEQDVNSMENRDLCPTPVDEAMSIDSTSDDDNRNEKEDSADAEEEFIPMSMKISPRCDVCGLLHFKRYRCITRFSAPFYLRKLFDESTEKLRVCRKCLASKENCVENVAISSLASYSAQIQQMKIPLGMTCERRTKAFEFVVRDLKHLKNGEYNENVYPYENNAFEMTPPSRKTMLERLNVDDPIQKNIFLKELNLHSADVVKSVSDSSDTEEIANGSLENVCFDVSDQAISNSMSDNDAVYHVAAKDVPTSLRNVTEKKIGEMFDARKGASHDLVVHTKRAWKPNKKYDDPRKIDRDHAKKEAKRSKGKSKPVKNKGESDQPDKVRTCGINCAVCAQHVQKSYSCCTLQNAPEKYRDLFTPGVTRLKICRKCIPYKKPVIKNDSQVVMKKKVKVKQKRGRKPKLEKPVPIVKALPLDSVLETKDDLDTATKAHGSKFISDLRSDIKPSSNGYESPMAGSVPLFYH